MRPTWTTAMILRILSLAILVCALQVAAGQDAQAPSLGQLQKSFDEKVATWRNTIKEIRSTGIAYLDSESAPSAKDLRKEWEVLREKGRAELLELIKATKLLYPRLTKPGQEITELLVRIQEKALKDGRSEEAYDVGQMLLKNLPQNENIQFATAKAAIKTNRFEEAAVFAENYGTMLQGETSVAGELFAQLPELRKKYERELELQTAETAADDLPRVTLETSQGTIVIELFENEAPATVANFISLVEAGKYNGMAFHRVIKDFMAQTGERYINGDYPNIDYTIYDECKEDDARFHFRGALSMAKTTQPDSGNIQFFICHRALSHLDGKHTVFGRIISGWDAFGRLTNTFIINDKQEEEPIKTAKIDYIVKAKVDRKRDHKYEIQKVPRR